MREEAFEEVIEDIREVGDHRPVDHGDEVGLRERLFQFIGAHGTDDVFVVDLVEAGHRAEHDFAIGKLGRVGDAGVSNGDRVGLGGKFFEDGEDAGLAECA